MTISIDRVAAAIVVAGLLCLVPGCGGGSAEPPGEAAGEAVARAETDRSPADKSSADDAPRFAPLDLDVSSGGGGSAGPKLTGAAKTLAVKENLRPLLLVIGRWNGTIQKKAGVEEVRWVYDVKTDETHPGLKMTIESGPYLKEGRLTYLPNQEQYRFTAIDEAGATLEFRGTFSEEPRDVIDPGAKKVQRTFKLELKRLDDDSKHKLARLVFNQRENNRYLLELYDRRGRRFDTVNTMREGTSFAVSEDYGEKECIISQGLGTISIDYEGKTYWVCCTGCEAEFKADPEKWIAKYNAAKAAEK